jgi:hypothetical protein
LVIGHRDRKILRPWLASRRHNRRLARGFWIVKGYGPQAGVKALDSERVLQKWIAPGEAHHLSQQPPVG